MGSPTNFPSGISTYPGGSVLASFPSMPQRYQISKLEDFVPYRSADFTATTAGTGAAIAAFSWLGGVVRLTCGSTTTFKALLAFANNYVQTVPGNGLWFEIKAGLPTAAHTNPSTDAAFYAGFCDNADPTAATNGIYFYKPSGGSAVHFLVLKAGTATTFQNVADFAKPSGAFADPLDAAGALTANTSGTTLTTLAVTTAGFGYRTAPLVIINGTGGTLAAAYVQVGGAAGFPSLSAKMPGSSLYSTIITAAGSGYTAGTFTADVIPWINLQFFYDGKGRLIVGVGGRIVLTLDKYAQTVIAPGATVNVNTGAKNYNFNTTSLGTVVNITPPAGDPIVALPLVPMTAAFGLVGTTANNRVAYVDELNTAVEMN
jgi:hypothetical protein